MIWDLESRHNCTVVENLPKNSWNQLKQVFWQSVSRMSRSVCYDVSLRVLRRKCHCKSSRMFNHSLHHHLLLWWWWFFILFSWFMTVNGRYLAFAKMAKWSDFSLHFLTELGCEMLADNGFVAYITQHKKIHHLNGIFKTSKDCFLPSQCLEMNQKV